MQRYHAASCTSAVNNSAIGGPSARDTSRADSSSLPANYSINQRRPPQLTPYKLRCDKEPLNSRLGPPDFHPQTPNCPEETLTKEYVQSGYRETVEGLEEAREIQLSQAQTFTKPVILKCREAIKKCHRAINESRAQKRKAGQVYGVPLSGPLLTKPGVFPEQRPCGEDYRRKWIEGLSQPHKRLRSLADHVPHGYRKKSLLEILIRNNVPLLRATWYIKVTYLNQVRPVSSSIASGVADKSQLSRTEQWTKDVIDYLQHLLDEFVSRNASYSNSHVRDRSPQTAYGGSMQQRSDPTSTLNNGEEPSIHFKWWYVVRILQWHHSEGLLLPSLVIDWVLNQLQEKDLLATLQLVLPILYGVMETVVLSQTYVRTVVGLAVRFIQEPSPGGSDLVDNSRRAYTTSALVEMLRYMILAVPDTFVALDCFPFPPCVVTSQVANDGNFLSKVSDGAAKITTGSVEVGCLLKDKGLEPQYQSISIDCVVSSVQKRTENLAMAARPSYPGRNVAKAVQELDKALRQGDVRMAYNFLFKDLCDGAVDESWVADVSPCLRSSLKWIGTVSLSFVCSVFFLCEWATCDFRDFRTAPPHGIKFSGRKDFSQVYLAIQILKLKIKDMQSSLRCKNDNTHGVNNSLAKGSGQLNKYSGWNFVGTVNGHRSNPRRVAKSKELSNIFESPGPLHDIIVCWIDQHEVHNCEGFKRLQLLIVELTRCGIFYPQAYVRQLIVSGIMDGSGPLVDLDRQKRHYSILKQLPGSYVRDALEEAQITDTGVLTEAINVYSNERRLLLRGVNDHRKNPNSANSSSKKQKNRSTSGGDLEELKAAISVLLQLPSSSTSTDTGIDESQGSVKRPVGSTSSIMDLGEGTPGCEECRRAKRQKLSEERSSYLQGQSPNPSDDEESWWVRKGLKSMEALKIEPPLKPPKQASRGRQKVVRKTQSLAQLAAARIEGSQGASTSHVCDSKVSCPHHRTGVDAEGPKSMGGTRAPHLGDIVSVGKSLKQLRFTEKRVITVWLVTLARELVEENERAATKVGQYSRPLPSVDDKNSTRWKFGDDELSALLYLMDVANDLVSAARFLIWLLPKVLSSPSSTVHGGRNILMLPRNVGSNACDVGEAFLLSSIRRYENILVATDLLPETLSAITHRGATIMASNGRVSGSATLCYARYLLKKYGSVASVVEWEKSFKATCDKRLLPELDSGRSLDGEFGLPLGVPAGVEDLDDFLRQKISGVRVSRVGLSMREIVQKHVEEAFLYYYGKERKLFATGSIKSPSVDKGDDGYQMALQIVNGLMECMRQTGGAAQEGDPSLVSSAVSAVVNSIGPVVAKIPDFPTSSNHLSLPSSTGPLTFARRILRIHITCLCLLKEALGERQSRVFEIALATEASSALAQAFGPGKAPRGQFQLSPESNDSSANLSNEILNSSAKSVLGRAAKIAAAVSALVVGAILHGVVSLERMVSVFRLKEGLDVIQFVRSTRSNSNGNARSVGALKVDNLVEISVHWFRVLVGNCRTVSDGLIVELLGEASVVGLSRMQRTLPLNLVFPPAYSIFAFVIWRPFIFNTNIVAREDVHQLYHSSALAISDAIKHLPFRDVCLRETRGFYDIVAADTTDSEFAAMLELNGPDMHLKAMAFVPLRARLFLYAVIDCKMPLSLFTKDDGVRGESGVQYGDNETKLLDKLVHVLDTLQPAKFHWQWIELRLLLNEQALIEKLESGDTSLAEAIRTVSSNPDKAAASENENNFIIIILTRLLVRPDAAPLFSEVIHLFGRSLEDSMLLQAKWFLAGPDVLFGRKSIRQRLTNIAESKGLSTKPRFRKPWGWCYSKSDLLASKGDVRKFEASSIEEGEVVEGTDCQQYVTERALIELVLSCIDQSSDNSRNTFANDLIKQMSNIELQINTVTRGASKQGGTVNSGIEGPGSKSNNRKGMRGGSPGIVRRPTVTADPVPPSPAALRASMSLRLQFLVRLLPIICADGEASARTMRHVFASVILHLLGSRVVHEDVERSFSPLMSSSLKRDVDLSTEAFAASAVDLSGESLFDRLLLVLHGLLSSCQPSWLKSKKDFSVFDREVAESLQNDLDRMHLPDSIRWRIQAAMPILFPSSKWSISCHPPSVSPAALTPLQPTISVSGSHPPSNLPQRNPVSSARNSASTAGRTKPLSLQQEIDSEMDPWMLLEDGAGAGLSSTSTAGIGGSDNANLRASSWLKGAVRVRRTDLTYIGVVDDDS
ncbi:mediator of RNA polymerase II transcription subunit 12 [Rhododendron vialii]|uniref:mediator of RNA polymerase II transcription subunit 12 n=1 Tax=Rhododendron vialii TaxID=182163 RepID=UPI00265F96A8|nr:mediator of RNA polymerase II transcription subunit 12 [Rhododendron vialii]XP_058225584.1 mediator of RNA polymerase II transcription subunit 12 [Rhododendron vialii]XP_058225585.1 mediator of RNA polymerase II transcription subunit 12 [Rhododendron vialii]XP_058225586.1 mediator of RNA polymerase II transcription subunit 12 [Rhododendron vialii]